MALHSRPRHEPHLPPRCKGIRLACRISGIQGITQRGKLPMNIVSKQSSRTPSNLNLLYVGPNAMCVPATGRSAPRKGRRMRTLQFGIEIETVGINRQALALAIHNVVAGAPGSPTMEPDGSWQATDTQGRAWRVVRDGSLSGGESSGEIVGGDDEEHRRAAKPGAQGGDVDRPG